MRAVAVSVKRRGPAAIAKHALHRRINTADKAADVHRGASIADPQLLALALDGPL